MMESKDWDSILARWRSLLGEGGDEPLIVFGNDERGEYWLFEVERKKFGRLTCKYYPAEALHTIRQYFEESIQKHPDKPESVELILGYVKEIFPKHIYVVLRDAIRQAAHEIISRTYWELRGTTHTLSPSAQKAKPVHAELAEAVFRPAQKAAMERMGLPTGGRPPELSDIQKDALPGIYRERHEDSKKVKAFHDRELKKFIRARRRGGGLWEDWQTAWLPLAKKEFPSLRIDYLALFSSSDQPSASAVTHKWLAKRLGCSADYIAKLLTSANKGGEGR